MDPRFRLASISFAWGFASAVSLPIGSIVGLKSNPTRWTSSVLMAFGGGALLFALSLELFGETLRELESYNARWPVVVLMLGSLAGGFIFELTDRALNSRGGFLRKLPLTANFLHQSKQKRVEKAVTEMTSCVPGLKLKDKEEVADLMTRMRREKFKKGEVIFHEISHCTPMYFVLSGAVRITYPEDNGLRKIYHRGQVFGRPELRSQGKPLAATAVTLRKTVCLELRAKECNWDFLEEAVPEIASSLLHRSAGTREPPKDVATRSHGKAVELPGVTEPPPKSLVEMRRAILAGRQEPSVSQQSGPPEEKKAQVWEGTRELGASSPFAGAQEDASEAEGLSEHAVSMDGEESPVGLFRSLVDNLEDKVLSQPVSKFPIQEEDVHEEVDKIKETHNSALAIWLGILIDGIPESLVIGILAARAGGMSYPFIVGVFLSNFPEAMSSSVSMRASGMAESKVLAMWMSIAIITGIGASAGILIFGAQGLAVFTTPYYVMKFVEGLAAGAMLTMCSRTIFPEAYASAGSIIGLATLFGFLCALSTKIV